MRRTTRPALRPLATAALSVLTLTAGAALGAAPAHADEASSTTVSIVSPEPLPTAPGTSYRDTVTVVLDIVAGPGETPRSATVTLGPRQATAALGADCATSCRVSVPVDTKTYTDPGNDPAARWQAVGDSGYPLDATVTSDTGSGPVQAQATSYVDMDNPVPLNDSLWQPSIGPVGPDETITVRASGAANAPVDKMVLTLLGPGLRRDVTITDTTTDSTWPDTYFGTAKLPVTGLPDGVYTVRSVLFAGGYASSTKTNTVRVYRGPQVKVLALGPAKAPNGTFLPAAAKVTYRTGPGGWPYAAANLEVRVDGATYTQGSLDRVFELPDAPCDGDCWTVPQWHTVLLPLTTDGFLAPGRHTVTVRYVEGYDWPNQQYATPSSSAETTQTFTVTTAGIQVATKVIGPVVETVSGTLQLTLTGTAGTNTPAPTVRTWKVHPYNQPTKVLGSGTCTTSCATATASVPLKSLPGSFPGTASDSKVVLEVIVTDSTGVTRTELVRVHVDALPRLTLIAPTRSAYGAKVKLVTAVQQRDNAMLPGVPVIFQARTVGSSTWRTLATVKTNSLGQAVTYPVATVNTVWRAVVVARPGYNGTATSVSKTTAVPARVTLTGAPGTAVAGRGYAVKAVVAPASSGRKVYFQVRAAGSATWSTKATVSTDRYGAARTTLKYKRGTWYTRAVVAATTSSSSGTSASAKSTAR